MDEEELAVASDGEDGGAPGNNIQILNFRMFCFFPVANFVVEKVCLWLISCN